ncbi:glutamate-1-semialdehyde-2,1-aminomutase [Suicoccus acidiformans]|uniref:Glutamate-1-semialdehyde 2,1-aminomutase n=1 Tax=Suicoccus acidiformans TaxID=2036206 RepID=A0A347WM22_9LACT|nr:glutamate-1-semialdehyde 2,1-aminomutase [Suicoccus acidiformans]AXY26129.1 glutamate-1-semialdehyde-2,1-aminomutase [Suicoccus acidiformans]
MEYVESTKAFYEAQKVFPGGVNSPVRAFGAMERDPIFIEKGEGAYLYDVDGNHYLDYVLSWGPLVLGHSDSRVVDAIVEQANKGTSYGATTPIETELGILLQSLYPSMEQLRFVNSGTEATMSAIRLARGYTGRKRIVKFSGCYHGHGDSFLVEAGSGVATYGTSNSAGVPEEIANLTSTLPYNDMAALEDFFELHGNEVAGVIIEPVAGNMGLVPSNYIFLQRIRQLTEEFGALLIFDEVMTGSRAAYRGAQEAYSIQPDITTLAKVIGGGLPCAAYGGKREIMAFVSPLGSVYQAGTLSGNPLAMAAGLATLKNYHEEDFNQLVNYVERLKEAVLSLAEQYALPVQFQSFGSMFSIFFSETPVENYADAQASNQEMFKRFFSGLLDLGIYIPPSQYETLFVSTKHGEVEFQLTVEAIDKVFQSLCRK